VPEEAAADARKALLSVSCGRAGAIDRMLQSGAFGIKALGFRVPHHGELLVTPVGVGLCSNMERRCRPTRIGPAGSSLQSERWDSHATMQSL
jgi:hypothetical protein